MKSRILIAVLLTAVLLVFTAFMFIRQTPQQKFLQERAELVVRNIGHRLLMGAGDFSSRILPVNKISEGVFRLQFEHDFSFKPDSLVKIAEETLAAADLPLNYRVNVFSCLTQEMVYGFEIRPKANDITPCLGRIQPKGCYSIQITFFENENAGFNHDYYYLSVIGLLGLIIFAFVGTSKTKRSTDEPQPKKELKSEFKSIGKFQFDGKQGVLMMEDKTIRLTNKESKVLSILSANLNELVDRDHLIKEIWENEGVVTGRSLDMFISKLRKKLSGDPDVGISNLHGRGYKLEIFSPQ